MTGNAQTHIGDSQVFAVAAVENVDPRAEGNVRFAAVSASGFVISPEAVELRMAP
ncbi:hypothetical protein [Pelagibacterium xiamenense]|uniref:hypothetical protein n=1 Tax=Pelagibacterium xiamenense TaxID=2901140 RepID=UPI001E62FF6D|nr:hypothetical protein [Pelagibacterium xiamenense]MCD7058713.1 hypothetical protein [Pelagibacterium xiamenense]